MDEIPILDYVVFVGVIAAAATIFVSVLTGLFEALLCLIQFAKGYRPWQTLRLLCTGILLVIVSGYLALGFILEAEGNDAGLGKMDVPAMLASCLAGLYGSFCLLRAVPVNTAEMRKGTR